ncbi:MAG TPA: right-handed parallel beta-helix repeat-containing protein, partial [Kiritimatiellia bacterium]
MRHIVIAVAIGLVVSKGALAATRFVAAGNPGQTAPFLTWGTAAATIQDAIDVSINGDTVLVSNGVYDVGGRAAPGHTLTNRVTIDRAVTVIGVNGPSVTTIQGQSPAGPTAVRCAYLTNGASLAGFTLEGGHSRLADDGICYTDTSGGGAFLDQGGLLSNCTVRLSSAHFGGGVFSISGRVANCSVENNSALAPPAAGGGIYGVAGTVAEDCTVQGNTGSYGAGIFSDLLSTFYACIVQNNQALQNAGGVFLASGRALNCRFLSNTANSRGGGAYCWTNGVLRNVLLSTNGAADGGGAFFDRGGTLENCTIAGNSATARAGGFSSWLVSTAQNCIVVQNGAPQEPNIGFVGFVDIFTYSCTAPAAVGDGNIFADPVFVDSTNSDYRLKSISPCADVGTNAGWMASTLDLDGRPRVWINRADMGAYEYNPPDLETDTDSDGVPDWWEWQYYAHVTNTPAGSDTDFDTMSSFEEWIAGTEPTNGASFFFVQSARRTGSQFVVTWPSVDGRVY